MKTVLITRPAEDSAALAGLLEARGFLTLAEPMLQMEMLAGCKPVLDAMLALKPRLILATSKYAVRFCASLTSRRDIPLRPVGAASAELASSLGFSVPEGHCETAGELLAFVEQHYTPAAGKMLYLRGEDVTVDVAGELAKKGFSVDAVVLYRAAPVKILSDYTLQELSSGRVAGVLFFSRRTAKIYTQLAEAHHAAEAHRSMRAVCMSSAIAGELRTLPWQSLHVAGAPDMAHMLAAAEEFL